MPKKAKRRLHIPWSVLNPLTATTLAIHSKDGEVSNFLKALITVTLFVSMWQIIKAAGNAISRLPRINTVRIAEKSFAFAYGNEEAIALVGDLKDLFEIWLQRHGRLKATLYLCREFVCSFWPCVSAWLDKALTGLRRLGSKVSLNTKAFTSGTLLLSGRQISILIGDAIGYLRQTNPVLMAENVLAVVLGPEAASAMVGDLKDFFEIWLRDHGKMKAYLYLGCEVISSLCPLMQEWLNVVLHAYAVYMGLQVFR